MGLKAGIAAVEPVPVIAQPVNPPVAVPGVVTYQTTGYITTNVPVQQPQYLPPQGQIQPQVQPQGYYPNPMYQSAQIGQSGYSQGYTSSNYHP